MSLPTGWELAPLGAIVEDSIKQGPPSSQPVPYIDIGSIDRVAKSIGETSVVTQDTAPTRARQWVCAGDVLVSMTRPNLNAVALVPRTLDDAVASTGFDVLRSAGVLPEWIFFRVRSAEFVFDVCQGLQGVVYPAIRPRDVRRHEIPIPPLAEQRRIVSEIERHFSRLDAAETALKRTRSNLRRYRASVLKAACEGRLVPTEAELARAEGRDYEPADQFLKRILAERHRRWEAAELAKIRARGKEPKDDRWKLRYIQPDFPDVSQLPGLPRGWCWTTVGQLGEVIGGVTKNPRRDHMLMRVPYLRVANVYAGELRLGEVLEIGVSAAELDRVLLQKDDLLVVEGNGSLDQIGRVALWDGSISPCAHQNHLIKVRFADAQLPSYVLHWLLSIPGRSHVVRVASSTSGLYNLSVAKVAALPVALPPLSEQHRIVREVSRQLSVADAMVPVLMASRTRSFRLRQAVLRRAFEGKLVPQDPNDEPASVLVERIRAGRQAAGNGGRERRLRRGRHYGQPRQAELPLR